MQSNLTHLIRASLIFSGLVFAVPFGSYAQTTGPMAAGLAELNPSAGSVAWSNEENVLSDPTTEATVSVPAGETSQYIVIRDIDFGIPESAVVNGISISVNRSKSAGNIKDEEVRLILDGVILGDNKASGDGWPTSGEVATYGSSEDSWGVELTGADVNSDAFGFVMRVFNDAGGGPAREAKISVITVEVEYTVPLPIALLSFDAVLSDARKVQLDWSTATEINNEFFTIERSRNGATFEEVGRIPGAGNSNTQRAYTYTDDAPLQGTSYYRLKQTDFSGEYEIFDMVAVEYANTPGGSCVLKVMPNPCVSRCSVNLSECKENEQSEIRVEMMDAAGNRVFSNVPYRETDGSFTFDVDVNNNLKPGIYIISGRSSNESYSEKIIAK